MSHSTFRANQDVNLFEIKIKTELYYIEDIMEKITEYRSTVKAGNKNIGEFLQ